MMPIIWSAVLVFPSARGDDDPFARRDAAEAVDGELPREEEHDDPGRDPAHRDHPDERRHHDELVGERVEELAEHADDAHPAREPAVEQVGDRGDA